MNKNNLFELSVSRATPEIVNALWAVLKYKEIGILKKAQSMAAILDINEEDFVMSLPQNDEGRILDKPSRYLIHDILIKYSNFAVAAN